MYLQCHSNQNTKSKYNYLNKINFEKTQAEKYPLVGFPSVLKTQKQHLPLKIWETIFLKKKTPLSGKKDLQGEIRSLALPVIARNKSQKVPKREINRFPLSLLATSYKDTFQKHDIFIYTISLFGWPIIFHTTPFGHVGVSNTFSASTKITPAQM